MIKTFVLDTSVVLFDPRSIYAFEDNVVHIPLTVVEELDKFKRSQNENGRNARQFSRFVDKLRDKGALYKGVELENGGKLVISLDKKFKGDLNESIDFSVNDNLILAKALHLKKDGNKVVLVSKDINLRVKADAVGVSAEDYGNHRVSLEDISSHRSIELDSKAYGKFEDERFLDIKPDTIEEIYPNEYFVLTKKDTPNCRLLARYNKPKNGMIPLIQNREGVWGIHPKNIEQQFALDALLNREVKLVCMSGKAGTGKTLLAIAAGLEMTVNRGDFKRLLVSRPIWPIGRDLGYLPGDIEDKLAPWMQPIFDNIDFLFGNKKLDHGTGGWEHLMDRGLLQVEPLTYIRGRSIPMQYLIVDEAQNLTPHEIKTIITRAGDETKIVLTGDCEQIDNPYLDTDSNGLSYCMKHLRDEEITANVVLKTGERSHLAEIASKLL